MVGEWAQNLQSHSEQVCGKYGFREALDEFTKSIGWILGLGMQQQQDSFGGVRYGVPLNLSSGF